MRELLKRAQALLELVYVSENFHAMAEKVCEDIEAELAKRDEPFGYMGGAWARIAANGGAWDSITVSREKLDESDCALYANPPIQQELLTQDAIIEEWQRKVSVMSEDEKDASNVIEFIRGARFAEQYYGIGGDLIKTSEHIAKLSRKETLEEVISIIPGGSVVDPQVICDEIRELMANDGTNEA